MRPGMQSLLDLLRGGLPQRTLNESEFAALLRIAEEENVLLWVAERLRPLDAGFIAERQHRLEQIRRDAELATFAWTQSLKGILAAFHRADLQVIALKGPCLAERLHGDASLRTCHDLDLLVRRSDLARAEELLKELGFHPNSLPDDYHRPWSRKALNLELHHNVENPHSFEFDLDAAWARATLSQFMGTPVWLFAPSDELLYLCLHAVRHRFERLSFILDLSLAFRRLALPATTAPQWGDPVFDNIIALGWMMAVRLDAGTPAPHTMRSSPRDRKRLGHLADRLWQEMMRAQPPMLDWAAQHRFYLEVETPGWDRFARRWRHQRILATRLIDEDFAFAGRFNLRRNWQVWLLRPVRLLLKTLRPSPRMM
jgi:Uncharacterised nucleotidyltransferase